MYLERPRWPASAGLLGESFHAGGSAAQFVVPDTALVSALNQLTASDRARVFAAAPVLWRVAELVRGYMSRHACS
jgi:hypothetical protein